MSDIFILKKCKKCLYMLFEESFRKHRGICKKCEIDQMRCIHNKIKSNCRECGVIYFCIHNKSKQICKECKGSKICIHNKRKSRCKECGASELCIHNIIKYSCRKCVGTYYCIHDKKRTICKDCNGGSLCIHKIIKSRCKECGGSSICQHNKRKDCCCQCNPNVACQECKSVRVDKRILSYPLCQACFCYKYPDHEKSTVFKIKERYLRDELREIFKEQSINMIFDKIIDGGCSKKRPDVLIDCYTHSIVIECDENQHSSYECENKRTMQLFEDLGNRPLVLIRFNPDNYIDENENKVSGCFKPLVDNIHKKRFYDINEDEWNIRINILEQHIKKYLLLEDFPNKEITEIKLFYSKRD